MSTFLNRLKYYGFGFLIGLIFVFLFFQNRGCSWLPANRVKNSILDRVIVVSEAEQSKLDARGISEDEVIALLNNGDVDFGKSRKSGKNKVYFVEKEGLKAYFTLPEESFVSEFRLADKAVSSIVNTTSGTGKMIRFPLDNDLVFVDSTTLMTCQQKALGLPDARAILKKLKKTGKVDFAKTDFRKKPKAEQYILFTDPKGREIGATAAWYKDKIRILRFDIPFPTGCR